MARLTHEVRKMASVTSEKEMLPTPEAAHLCSIGERTLWRWSRDGTAPPPIKIGSGKQGAVRYSRRALLAWIEAGCPRCDGEPADE